VRDETNPRVIRIHPTSGSWPEPCTKGSFVLGDGGGHHGLFCPGWRLDRPDRNPHAILEWDAHVDGTGSLRLLVDGQTVADSWVTSESLPGSLDQSLHLAIAEFSPQAVFLHAGVTAWNGAAILIPGRTILLG
jgi:hypothetical protein